MTSIHNNVRTPAGCNFMHLFDFSVLFCDVSSIILLFLVFCVFLCLLDADHSEYVILNILGSNAIEQFLQKLSTSIIIQCNTLFRLFSGLKEAFLPLPFTKHYNHRRSLHIVYNLNAKIKWTINITSLVTNMAKCDIFVCEKCWACCATWSCHHQFLHPHTKIETGTRSCFQTNMCNMCVQHTHGGMHNRVVRFLKNILDHWIRKLSHPKTLFSTVFC